MTEHVAGKELDDLIAEKLGWHKGKGGAILPHKEDPYYWYTSEGYRAECRVTDEFMNVYAWSPSVNIADTWQLLEIVRLKGWEPVIRYDRVLSYWVANIIPSRTEFQSFNANADTAPLAFTLAFLKASENNRE